MLRQAQRPQIPRHVHLIAFGVGVVAQTVLSQNANGSYLAINIGWGLAVMLGVVCVGRRVGCAPQSGRHASRSPSGADFPWAKVPVYVAAQIAGAFVASAVVFATYRDAFDGLRRRGAADPGRAGHRRHLRHLPAAVPVDRWRPRRSDRRHRAADGRGAGDHRSANAAPPGWLAPRRSSAGWSWRSASRSASMPATRSTRRATSGRGCSPRWPDGAAACSRRANGWWWVPIVGADAWARSSARCSTTCASARYRSRRERDDEPLRSRARSGHDVEPRRSCSIVPAASVAHGAAGVSAAVSRPRTCRARSRSDLGIAAADRAGALARAGITAADLAAIGVTNQRETTVLWERATGKPIANAIVWQSRITAPICDRLKADGHEPIVPPQDRPGRRRVFLRHQDQAPARLRTTACARRAGARRGAVRHDRLAS